MNLSANFKMPQTKHWGEFQERPECEPVPDVTADIERSMNKFFLNDFEDSEDEKLQLLEKISLPHMNPYIEYAISLHEHLNLLSDMIGNHAKKTKEDEIKSDIKMPEAPIFPKNMCLTNEIPDLSRAVAKQILYKSIATLFAQIGYETAEQSCLEAMTDILIKFFEKFAHSLKTALEYDDKNISQGFPNAIERVLVELGLGGVKGVSDYYQKRVINYVNVLQKRCFDLNAEYQAMLLPKCDSPVDKLNKVIRVKVEEEDVMEAENPEVHFPTIEGDVNLSFLETGYQLLHSLEAETNLQSLAETEDDVSSTHESPGVVTISEGEVPHLSHYGKKKRFK